MPFSSQGAVAGASAGASFGPWGAVIGGVAGGLLGGGQKAPAVATYAPISPQEQQKQALEGNLTNESSIEALLSRSNKFNQSQSLSLMEQAMPGYTALSKKLTGLASDLATNPYNLPTDVQANLERQAAERGIVTGRGGQAGDFSLLRDLGVNELQYGQSRINQAGGITSLLAGIAPKVNPMSPMSFYVTPQEQISTQQSNEGIQTNIAQGGFNAQAAASNYNNANNWQNITNAAVSLSKNGFGGWGKSSASSDGLGDSGKAAYG